MNVDLFSAGASMVAYHFTVDRKDLKNTINAIHEEFFKSETVDKSAGVPLS